MKSILKSLKCKLLIKYWEIRHCIPCENCHKMKPQGKVRTRSFYGIPNVKDGIITSRSKFCSKCYKSFTKVIKQVYGQPTNTNEPR